MKSIIFIFVVFVGSSPLVISLAFVSALACKTKSGSEGNCKPITECPLLSDILSDANGDDYDFIDLMPCNSRDAGSIGEFCCPLNLSDFNYYSSKKKKSQDSDLTKTCQKLVQLKEQLRPKLIDFGESSMTAVGVKVGELPFMAQIYFDEKTFAGAGALISEKFVLTTAHIVYGHRNLMPFVTLGKTKINVDNDDDDNTAHHGITVDVKKVILHDLYQHHPKNSSTADFDFALLMFKTPIKFYNHIWAACLYPPLKSSEIENDEEILWSGWQGKNLMKFSVKKVDQVQCQKSFFGADDDKKILQTVTKNDIFCTRCQDFGGAVVDFDGLLFIYTNQSEFFIFALTTNMGTKLCGDDSDEKSRRNKFFFNKVSSVTKWIENIISN